jgi:hypothetical protein
LANCFWLKTIILTLMAFCSAANPSFALDAQGKSPATVPVQWDTLNRLILTCHGLASFDVRDFAHRGDISLVAATIVPGKGSGNMIENGARPSLQGGNAEKFSGTIHVDYAAHAAWIGKTYHYAFTIPATFMTYFHGSPFNEHALVFGGEIVYGITGDSPVFQRVPDNYLIPDGYQKYLPEAVEFCQSNAKQLQSNQTERGMLTALLSSSNLFLKLMAVRELSEDPLAMHSSTAPARMLKEALSAHRELQAALVAIILSGGDMNAQNLIAAIIAKVKDSREPSDYEYLALGCNVAVEVSGHSYPFIEPDRQSAFIAMAAKQSPLAPSVIHSSLVDSIILPMRLPEMSQSKTK